jgi:hypothetical protein
VEWFDTDQPPARRDLDQYLYPPTQLKVLLPTAWRQSPYPAGYRPLSQVRVPQWSRRALSRQLHARSSRALAANSGKRTRVAG